METAHDNGAAPAALNPDAIPAELKSWPQWVARRGKVLVDPKTGGNAKTNAASTWGTFDDAVARSETDGLDGVGFVFAAWDPYAFIDLDGCLDPETGEADPWALEVVRKLETPTRSSPRPAGACTSS
jgi:primase-polymerase (primpol)-like protein